MVKVLYISVDGQIGDKEARGYNDYLDMLDGGWLEAVPFPPGCQVAGYCDEEGKLKGLPVNHIATMLLNRIWFESTGQFPNDVLCGPVIIIGPASSEGDETDITQEIITLTMLLMAGAPIATQPTRSEPI